MQKKQMSKYNNILFGRSACRHKRYSYNGLVDVVGVCKVALTVYQPQIPNLNT